jgi:pyruvate/2-oxoglutarate dehydrogenase complex dihydrolipoamide dehydrogenase (E3) component
MDFDAIVIGAGQAGPAMAEQLAKAGERVAIIERLHMGGTCVNNGCMPTKAMVASAYAAYLARNGARFGVGVDGVRIDWSGVHAHKEAVVQTARGNVTRWMENTPGVTLVRGHARFTSPHTVDVDGQELRGKRFFINVGACAVVPPVPGIDLVRVLTNADIMDVDRVPEHLLIVGGSYIGLEFAQIFRRLGSSVTVVERFPQIIAREDPDVIAAVHQILTGEGIDIHTGVEDLAFVSGEPIRYRFTGTDGKPREGVATHVLAATGRRPNTDDLGLTAAGLVADPRGFIPVDDACRTAVPHIWVLGEANGRGAFTHTAYNDFEIVAGNLLHSKDRKVTDRQTCYGLFIDPPLGRIGMTEAAARSAGRPMLVGKRMMTRVGRAVESGETRGFMKIVIDAEHRTLLGAAVIGYRGDEAVQTLLAPLYKGMTIDEIMAIVGIHPTVSELLPYAIASATSVT